MRILAIHTNHDASVAVFDDYEKIFIAKEERLNRIKNYGYAFPQLAFDKMKREVGTADIDMLVLTRGVFPRKYFRNQSLLKRLERSVSEWSKGEEKLINLGNSIRDSGLTEAEVFDLDSFMRDLGLAEKCQVRFANHHWCHALPTLFYRPEWDKAFLYTADGGGDFIQYSLTHFDGQQINRIYGSDELIYEQGNDEKRHSVGQMYSIVTYLAGFKPVRHEGKITGLAAYGKPSVYDQLRPRYHIREDGLIRSDFSSYEELKDFMKSLSELCSIEDLSASAQKVLEDTLAESVKKLKKIHDFNNIGLCGGVFANVRLNQVISEVDGIDDVFVMPPMGDEGLVIGAILDTLLERDGLDAFLAQRRDLGNIYWGDDYSDFELNNQQDFDIICDTNIPQKAAELLQSGKVCALYTLGMEYGPRALGARSIMINPADKSINDSVNQRLSRTEFMPFAPVVRNERLEDVFVVTPSNRRPMQYMTITCDVKQEWQDKIPAVVHVDGTARPQTISEQQNPLYYNVLLAFEQLTGLPCLVNTSFNAHEEPIINTPKEALNALKHDRIDYLITEKAIIGRKKAS